MECPVSYPLVTQWESRHKVSVLKDPIVKSESCSIIKGKKPDPLKAFKRKDRDADEIQTVIRKMVKRYEFYMETSFSKYSSKYHYNVEWNFRVIIFFSRIGYFYSYVKLATSGVLSHISLQSSDNKCIVSPTPWPWLMCREPGRVWNNQC